MADGTAKHEIALPVRIADGRHRGDAENLQRNAADRRRQMPETRRVSILFLPRELRPIRKSYGVSQICAARRPKSNKRRTRSRQILASHRVCIGTAARAPRREQARRRTRRVLSSGRRANATASTIIWEGVFTPLFLAFNPSFRHSLRHDGQPQSLLGCVRKKLEPGACCGMEAGM